MDRTYLEDRYDLDPEDLREGCDRCQAGSALLDVLCDGGENELATRLARALVAHIDTHEGE